MILLIDNYDSFVYNLARYVKELGEVPLVCRHDAITVAEVEDLAPSHIIISPGPCSPKEAGISTDIVRELGAHIPVLGVCLGHQCIGAAYGGEIVRAALPMHGKPSRIHHAGQGLFAGLPSPFIATRYHSLVVAPASIPPELVVTATSEDGEIMAVEHREHPVYGLQFHPESVLTEQGYRLLDHFLHGVPTTPRLVPLAADGALVPTSSETVPLAAAPPPARSGPVIVETIVTTLDGEGHINFAPMGVEWGEEVIILKPFLETTTFKNLRHTGAAVVNLTDDAMLFAQGAISSPQFPSRPANVVRGVVLQAACSWRELEVLAIDDTPPRSRIEARVVHRGVQREFIGFNRARHAILEAAILATRTHLLPAEEIRSEYVRLQVIVDKTAGPREREAMDLLTQYVRSR